LLEPVFPAVTDSQAAFVVAVHATFPVTAIDRPLHAALVRLVLAGLIPSVAAAPACVTTQVRDSPPPATITPPVRALVPGFAATLKVTVPLLEPVFPAVTESHAAFVVAVHATFPVTAIVRPLHAALVRLVLAGLIPSVAAATACARTLRLPDAPA
jgi:hypothetical protein